MAIKTRQDLIKVYLDFFKSKNHKIMPSSSLIPENDPTVLFTTAGMHPLVPYLLGQKHPLGKRLASVQKCIRTGDIEEVGDKSHLTFFEMLGNWSLGDYFKEDAIKLSFEFITKELKIPKEKISITVFSGDKENKIERDEQSARIWQSLGIKKEKIKFLGKKDNWWGPAGETGPCGPDTEMFVNNIEFWNDVFMQYNKNKNGNYEQLTQKNVDTGMGVERTIAILNNLDDTYETTIFQPLIKKIEEISGKKYRDDKNKKPIRIIADHIRAAIFILADEHHIKPSNIGQGYVLRRLIRRAIRYGKILGIKENFTAKLIDPIINVYSDYKELHESKNFILTQLNEEENKFSKTIENGLRKFEQLSNLDKKELSGKSAFLLFQSYGFPIEMTQELAKEKNIKIDIKSYEIELKKHQELSRTASAGIFKSGLADKSETTTKLHTVTHILNQALKEILHDNNISQKGSNITPERLRFDFNFPRKLTDEEIKKIEDWVNKIINENLPVKKEEMSLDKALKLGARGEFGAKYPGIVSVYKIGNISKEICAGPHVKNTKEIGKFKIIKEESSSAGIRRIKAIIE